MGTPRRRYVGHAIPGDGWRIWDSKRKRYWGRTFPAFPSAMLDELNGDKDQTKVVELARISRAPKRP